MRQLVFALNVDLRWRTGQGEPDYGGGKNPANSARHDSDA